MRCKPLDADEEVSGWLARKLRPDLVARVIDHDLARALPRRLRARWAVVGGKPWAVAGFLLVVPLYDATGAHVALHARRITEPGDGLPKTATPYGCSTHGLVMGNALARRMLAGHAEALPVVRDAGLVIVEGFTDYLACASSFSDADDEAPAVLGIVSGSWSDGHGQALAARIPDGTPVLIATDDDDAGERYERQIVATLRPRTRAGALPPLRRKKRQASIPET